MQIEQPFEVLPLPHFCAAIKKHVLDMVSIHAEAKALARREWPMTPSAMTPAMSPSPSQTVSPTACGQPTACHLDVLEACNRQVAAH